MAFSTNLQYLRRLQVGLTQEKLAEKLGVSRQSVSNWEAGEGYPEIEKLLQLCELFHCKLDALLREDMTSSGDIYSPITIETVPAFRMARYVVISPSPEDDVNGYMDRWAEKNGLLSIPGCKPRRIGWDFPFVSQEQRMRFGLRGYVAAYVLPDEFQCACASGVEFFQQAEAQYAVITIRDPFQAAFERIPNAYKRLLEHLKGNGFKEKPNREDVLACFEWVYEEDGVEYMKVYLHLEDVGKGNVFTGL